MEIDLSKDELIALIKGLEGYQDYRFAEELSKEGWGDLKGFPNERWFWDDQAFRVRSEQQLYDFYKRLKKKSDEDKEKFFKKFGV